MGKQKTGNIEGARVHILLLDLGNEMRGGQRQVVYLARALGAMPRFSVCIATPQGSPLARAAQEAGVAVLPLCGRRSWNPAVMAQAFRFIQAQDNAPVILHSNDAHSAALSANLHRLAHAFGKTTSRLVHSRRVSYPLKKGMRGQKYFCADAIVGVSREIADVIVASGMDKEKVYAIHSGIEIASYPQKQEAPVEKLAPAADNATASTASTASTTATVQLGIVGALTKQKGHEVLLRALALLAHKSVPAWELQIVGDGALRENLEHLAVECGIAQRVHFCGWQESRAVLPQFDMLIVPSVNGEGSSATIKEAWAVGLPLIASDLPSNLELVRPNMDGLAFESGNPEALCHALEKLLCDPALAARLAQEGKKRVQEFSVERMADAYITVYDAIL